MYKPSIISVFKTRDTAHIGFERASKWACLCFGLNPNSICWNSMSISHSFNILTVCKLDKTGLNHTTIFALTVKHKCSVHINGWIIVRCTRDFSHIWAATRIAWTIERKTYKIEKPCLNNNSSLHTIFCDDYRKAENDSYENQEALLYFCSRWIALSIWREYVHVPKAGIFARSYFWRMKRCSVS